MLAYNLSQRLVQVCNAPSPCAVRHWSQLTRLLWWIMNCSTWGDANRKISRCRNISESSVQLGAVSIVLSWDDLQLLPVIQSIRWMWGGRWNNLCVNVLVLDKIPWCSGIWKNAERLRITTQARQNIGSSLPEIITKIFDKNVFWTPRFSSNL